MRNNNDDIGDLMKVGMTIAAYVIIVLGDVFDGRGSDRFYNTCCVEYADFTSDVDPQF